MTILEDEQAMFVMSVFRRSVYESIGGSTKRSRTNEDYDYWIRAAAAGFVFARNDGRSAGIGSGRQPLGERRPHGVGHPEGLCEDAALFGGRPAEMAVSIVRCTASRSHSSARRRAPRSNDRISRPPPRT